MKVEPLRPVHLLFANWLDFPKSEIAVRLQNFSSALSLFCLIALIHMMCTASSLDTLQLVLWLVKGDVCNLIKLNTFSVPSLICRNNYYKAICIWFTQKYAYCVSVVNHPNTATFSQMVCVWHRTICLVDPWQTEEVFWKTGASFFAPMAKK